MEIDFVEVFEYVSRSPYRITVLPSELLDIVETVLSSVNVTIENGEHIGKQGAGQFIKRTTCVEI